MDKTNKSKELNPEQTVSEITVFPDHSKNELAALQTTNLTINESSSNEQSIPQNQLEQKDLQPAETIEAKEVVNVQEIETQNSIFSNSTTETSVKLAPQKIKKSKAALRQAKGPKKPKSNSKQKSAGAVLAGVIIILGLFIIIGKLLMNLGTKAANQAVNETVDALNPE